MGWDNNVFYNGRYNVDINNSLIYENDTCNNLVQSIVEIPIGWTLKLSGWIKNNRIWRRVDDYTMLG